YLFVRVAISLIQAVSIETCQTVTSWIAWLACDVLGIRRKIVHENLTIAYPNSTVAERSRLARRMWEHLLIMVCEIALAPRKIHETNWRRHVTFPCKRAAVRTFLAGRPKVVVTAHFGNFEVGGYVTGFWG